MTLEEVISIKSKHNPFLSSQEGIGIHFEFIYQGGIINLTANNGTFKTWDIESGNGPVTDLGKTYEINESGHVFWSPDEALGSDKNAVNIVIRYNGYVVGLASAKVIKDPEESGTFYAALEKTIEFPPANGNFQEIEQGYIDDFFKDK